MVAGGDSRQDKDARADHGAEAEQVEVGPAEHARELAAADRGGGLLLGVLLEEGPAADAALVRIVGFLGGGLKEGEEVERERGGGAVGEEVERERRWSVSVVASERGRKKSEPSQFDCDARG